MPPLGRLLVGTDCSPRAERALARAAALAAVPGARALTLLHVARRPGDHRATARALDARLARMALPAGVERHAAVATGAPFVELIRRARDEGSSLIVVGAHGEHFLRDLLPGTTAEKVVRKGDRPVLVVKRPAREPYRRLVVAVDLSDESRAALALALEVAPLADCHVLHVHETFTESRLRVGGASPDERARYRRGERARAADALRAFLATVRSDGRRLFPVVRLGEPAHAIPRIAERLGADLIATGTAGRSGLPYVLLGSVAEHVLREAPCDVLAVRAGARHFELP